MAKMMDEVQHFPNPIREGSPPNWTRFADSQFGGRTGRCGEIALLRWPKGLMPRAGFLALRAQVDVAAGFGNRVRA